MLTSSAKNKGRRLQQWLAKKISELLDIPWGADEQISSRPGSCNGTDIILTGEAKKRFKFSCECKNQQSWSVHKWIEQARENELPGTDWLLCAKRNHMKPVIIIDAEVFFKLVSQIK